MQLRLQHKPSNESDGLSSILHKPLAFPDGRPASHAGSWYTASGSQLKAQLERNLAAVKPIDELDYYPPIDSCKALIGPHAGYSYSGPAAAWAYAAIPVHKIKRVFLLGPSHHHYLNKIALSKCTKYATPLGDIPIDTETLKKLKQTGLFDTMDLDIDSDEHSLEMHLPYIRLIFQDSSDLSLVPLLVGNVSENSAAEYAEVFQEYWEDDETFWVISSDFCHWGTRFNHTPYYPNPPPIVNPVPPAEGVGSAAASPTLPPKLINISRATPADQLETPIWQSIQYMDHEAMDILRNGGKEGTGKEFRKYLRRTGVRIACRAEYLGQTAGPDTGAHHTNAHLIPEYDLWQEPHLGISSDTRSVYQKKGDPLGNSLCAL
ncbi:hypothetical protein QFC19_002928 [Naganishia cerealis]|uniref:Uncharacterized protein n=1 Tax=Naganishia cerealis TaxID=610337 RepID=A0ACC2W6M1_9TREE|nr:hypothetical protein QFC19_002928 [Naganishia cerealis]